MQSPLHIPSLLLLLAGPLVSNSRLSASDPVPTPAQLLTEYKALGLPLFPKTAKLVRFEGFKGEDEKVDPEVYALAFESKPGTKSTPPVIFWYIDEVPLERGRPMREVKPEPTTAKGVGLNLDGQAALILAIQCEARGWNELAQVLLDRSLKGAEETPRKQLVDLAWLYWWGQVNHPTADRRPVAKRLKELINRDADFNTHENRALLRDLERTLAPSTAEPGSVKAAIDGLVDYNADTGPFDANPPGGDAYWRVAKFGFDAVPALIDHLGDDRLTRATMNGFNNFWPWRLRVKDVVGDLLVGLAAEELMRGDSEQNVGGDSLRRQQGWRVTKAAASEWWKKAQMRGEEAYLLDHVLPPVPKEGKQAPVNTHLLRVIAAKYPKQVPILYRTVLDKRPELDSTGIAEALAKGPMPAKDKIELYQSAVKHSDFAHRLPALRALKDFDKDRFTTLLAATIESFPKDTRDPYWRSPEVRIAGLAVESDDPQVWAALEKAAKRSVLGLRIELLNEFGDPQDLRRRGERLNFLASFLNDDAVRDIKSEHELKFSNADDTYDPIEVRNFVAIAIANLLGIEVELKLDRTPAEWAKVRDTIREALKRELDKKK